MRLIDKQVAIKIAESYGLNNGTTIGRHSGIADLIAEELGYLPTIEAKPVVHGKWEWFEEWSPSTTEHPRECDDCGWRCSRCKIALEDMVGGYWDNPDEEPKLNYCPNCGVKTISI